MQTQVGSIKGEKTTTERDGLVGAAELALAVAGDELPAYSCPKCPRRFTHPQLLARRVLKVYLKQI